MVGYVARANCTAAFTEMRPFVSRGLPSGVVLGLWGSVLLLPAYTSWLHIDTRSVRNSSGAVFTWAIRPGVSKSSRAVSEISDLVPALGCGFPASIEEADAAAPHLHP